MNETTTTWVDGTLHPGDQPAISVFDRGLTVGDGVFETMKIVSGYPFALRRHLLRLRRSARGLGLEVPLSDSELRDAIITTIDANRAMHGRLRVTMTAGIASPGSDRLDSRATVIITISEMPRRADTANVVTVPWRRNEHSAVSGLKTTSYAENIVALTFAHDRGADEAIFANTGGDLCEGTATNIFIGSEGRLMTPPLSSGCLDGVTRELVMEATDVIEVPIPMEQLRRIDEAFLTSSTRDVQPIAAIDGVRMTRVPGPLTLRAQAAFAELASSSPDP